MATEPVAKLLAESAELRAIASELARIKRLQRRYRALVPGPLAQASRVCAMDGSTVVIRAESGPVAAVLRQLAPRVLEGLRDAARKSPKHSMDQELNGIRIEVQVRDAAAPRPVAPRAELPREQLRDVASRLSDSPLKETLERISGRKR